MNSLGFQRKKREKEDIRSREGDVLGYVGGVEVSGDDEDKIHCLK